MHASALLAGAALVTAVACGGGNAEVQPAWRSLAAGFAPSSLPAGSSPWSAEPALALTPTADGAGWWVDEMLLASAWSRSGSSHVWTARASMPGSGRPPDGAPGCALTAGERSFSHIAVPGPAAIANPEKVPPGSFALLADTLSIALAPGETPPAEAHLRTYVDRGKPVDGRWRVTLGGATGDGLLVLPGHSEELVVDLPPSSALRFATAACAYVGPPKAGSGAPLTFKIELDGASLFETLLAPGAAAAPEWHAVALPEGGRKGARLVFSVGGPPALAAFLSPALGPREVGSYGARPFEGRRPDLVLFLADTFRADNLALYGGTQDLTPVLDRFAGGALAFERAWSPASWTLPSQASMLSGLAPHQHSADGPSERLPADFTTIAERLRDAGYRTGAITEGAFVSQSFGMDQGFEVFDERAALLEDPAGALEAARAFLDADDGRPVFLFLQTYRTHAPYRVSEETHREHGARLKLAGPQAVVDVLLQEARGGWTQGQPASAELRAAVTAYRGFYDGSVIDLDRAFGGFLDALAARGLDRTAVVVFTSDHGEAFLEHDRLAHGCSVNEELVRIPLLLRGPGIAPGRSPHAATLLDLPRTLAQLAGADPAPSWSGRSLLDLDAERPVFAFECSMVLTKHSTLAVIDGQRKVIAEDARDALERGELLHAYDLARDPSEAQDALGAGAAWPAEVFSRHRGQLDPLLVPLSAGEQATLDSAQSQELQKLGY